MPDPFTAYDLDRVSWDEPEPPVPEAQEHEVSIVGMLTLYFLAFVWVFLIDWLYPPKRERLP